MDLRFWAGSIHGTIEERGTFKRGVGAAERGKRDETSFDADELETGPDAIDRATEDDEAFHRMRPVYIRYKYEDASDYGVRGASEVT